MTPTGARVDLEVAERGAEAVMAFLATWRRVNWKQSWRRSSYRYGGLTKRKYRRQNVLNLYIDGINNALDRVMPCGR